MATIREQIVKQAAYRLLPALETELDRKRRRPLYVRQPMRRFLQAAIGGAVSFVPHLPDETLISIFSRNLKDIPYPEGREFAATMLLSLKRLLLSPQYKGAAKHLVKNLVSQQFDLTQNRYAFLDKYGFLPPGLVVISPTMTCNLRCYGCYAGEYNKGDDLPMEVIRRVIREIKGMGIFFVVVSGGEPFFSEDVIQMWEENPEMMFLVYTNGTLIDEAMARRLARMNNVYPCISVEGYETETDGRRGKGTFAKVMAAMDNLRSAGVLYGFSATAIRSNNELITSDEFIDFFVSKGCVLGWYFNYMPIGREPDLSLMPTPEQRIARWQRINEMRHTKPIVLADFWCDGSLVGGCISGGRHYLHINSKGDVEPCVFAHFAADNIKDKSLTEILHSTFFKAIRAKQPFSENLLRPCMIIDHPQILRQVVAEGGAHPTHLGAETVITKLAPDLDEYGKAYGKIADRAWEEAHVLCCSEQPGKQKVTKQQT